ncbi:hypothetical protein M427DRAFT_256870 [Gonapodya prolifera JEL478]|uniref:Uncharacterized protein n=1 Tax=Gonapodya prolifera (strain JEL478) TaxID=1344416 RepID=A0A138ZX94_GONPJ|nr:hypothetical protein M427DRAFT_256870 [Gonapodya prolifera JEL478]|eukprot:KXS09074.1 hypothetical protein M427DRAFT_256870 [Gonapodya prolifera JEL478]
MMCDGRVKTSAAVDSVPSIEGHGDNTHTFLTSAIGMEGAKSYTRMDLDREALVWSTMSSPFVLPLHGDGFDVKRQPFFVCPVMANGSADEYLNRKGEGVGRWNGELLRGVYFSALWHCSGNAVLARKGWSDPHRSQTWKFTRHTRRTKSCRGFRLRSDHGWFRLSCSPGNGSLSSLREAWHKLGVEGAKSSIRMAGGVYALGIMMRLLWTPKHPPFGEIDADTLRPYCQGCALTFQQPCQRSFRR